MPLATNFTQTLQMLARMAEERQYACPSSILDATEKVSEQMQLASLTGSMNKHNQHERKVTRKVSVNTPLGTPNSSKIA